MDQKFHYPTWLWRGGGGARTPSGKKTMKKGLFLHTPLIIIITISSKVIIIIVIIKFGKVMEEDEEDSRPGSNNSELHLLARSISYPPFSLIFISVILTDIHIDHSGWYSYWSFWLIFMLIILIDFQQIWWCSRNSPSSSGRFKNLILLILNEILFGTIA